MCQGPAASCRRPTRPQRQTSSRRTLTKNDIDHLNTGNGQLNNADTATLSLADDGTADVADNGFLALDSNETVNRLYLGGILQAGDTTYGSLTSLAANKSGEYFSVAGILTVHVPEPGTAAMLLGGLGVLLGFRRKRVLRALA